MSASRVQRSQAHLALLLLMSRYPVLSQFISHWLPDGHHRQLTNCLTQSLLKTLSVYPFDIQMTNLGAADHHVAGVGHETRVQCDTVTGDGLPKGAPAVSQASNEGRVCPPLLSLDFANIQNT